MSEPLGYMIGIEVIRQSFIRNIVQTLALFPRHFSPGTFSLDRFIGLFPGTFPSWLPYVLMTDLFRVLSL